MVLLTKVTFISCEISIQLLLIANTLFVLFLQQNGFLLFFNVLDINLIYSFSQYFCVFVQVPYTVHDILNNFTWCNCRQLLLAQESDPIWRRSLQLIIRRQSPCQRHIFCFISLLDLSLWLNFQYGKFKSRWWVFFIKLSGRWLGSSKKLSPTLRWRSMLLKALDIFISF